MEGTRRNSVWTGWGKTGRAANLPGHTHQEDSVQWAFESPSPAFQLLALSGAQTSQPFSAISTMLVQEEPLLHSQKKRTPKIFEFPLNWDENTVAKGWMLLDQEVSSCFNCMRYHYRSFSCLVKANPQRQFFKNREIKFYLTFFQLCSLGPKWIKGFNAGSLHTLL